MRRGPTPPQACSLGSRPTFPAAPTIYTYAGDAHREHTHTLDHAHTCNCTQAKCPKADIQHGRDMDSHMGSQSRCFFLCALDSSLLPHLASFSLPAKGSPLPGTLHLSCKHKNSGFQSFL